MTSQIPLYSRGRPLKNLIADFKKKYNVERIVVDWDYYNDPSDAVEDDEIDLYEAVINHWYFANIGFDTDEQFIYRFNAVWGANINKYKALYKTIFEKGYAFDALKKTIVTDKSGKDTLLRKGSGTTSTVHSGIDEYEKGVTTTSTQSTSNKGDKLTRATPNETLNVDGSSDTTVQDSGADKTKYGHTMNVTENPNYENEQSYGSKLTIDNTEIREKLTPDELSAIYKGRSVLQEFAYCFENLFMGVID